MEPRFLQLAEVSEILSISAAQTYALVRNGSLPAIKVGGRGQWRVEVSELEDYIKRCYDETRRFVAEHPLGARDDPAGADSADEPADPREADVSGGADDAERREGDGA
ncbi:MAG: helix-turn-helix domain-containing protein [Mycobacteriales bacterium]